MTPRRRGRTPLPALLLGVAAVTAVAALLLSSGGDSSAPPGSASGAVGAGPFRTAATMPAGLTDRSVPKFVLADARGGTLSSRSLSGRPYARDGERFDLQRCVLTGWHAVFTDGLW